VLVVPDNESMKLMKVFREQDLKPVDGGLKEFEIILHDFSLGMCGKTVLYSVNSNRHIYELFFIQGEKFLESLTEGEWRSGLHKNREGFCDISHIKKSSKFNNNNSGDGTIQLDDGVDLNLNLYSSALKTHIKDLFLEQLFIVVLNVRLQKPIECFSNIEGEIFIKCHEAEDNPNAENGLRTLPLKASEITFDYSIIHSDDPSDCNPHQCKGSGGELENYEWLDSKLVKKSTSPPVVKVDCNDIF